jgi:hypothetical protein
VLLVVVFVEEQALPAHQTVVLIFLSLYLSGGGRVAFRGILVVEHFARVLAYRAGSLQL